MEIETNNPTLEISSAENEVGIETPKTVVNKNHAIMNNLDYENSGHTGFASSKDIEEINNKLSDLENPENMSGNASDISYEDNTGQGVGNVQGGLDEAFNSIERINNSLDNINGKNIHYEDDYGYGTPDNMQDAVNFAFEELENRATYGDLEDRVAFGYKQNKTETEKDRARENIGISSTCVFHHKTQNLSEIRKRIARQNIGVRGFTDLGEIDLADYDDSVDTFIGTLTEEGTYKFVDNVDNFTWVVEVWWLGDYALGQKYFYEEEGFAHQYYRNGYYNEDDDTYEWTSWDNPMTYEMASNSFANKSHTHYSTITTPYDIRGYLDRVTNYNIKELRITSSQNKHLYIAKVDYVNYNVTGGGSRYVRYQEYFDIEEPNKIYKRTGFDTKSSVSNITWGDWYVFEGEAE